MRGAALSNWSTWMINNHNVKQRLLIPKQHGGLNGSTMTNSPEFQIPYPPHWLTSVKSYFIHNIFSKYHSAQKRGQLPVVSFDSAFFTCPLSDSPIRPKLPERAPFFPLNYSLHLAQCPTVTEAQEILVGWIYQNWPRNCIANLILVLQKHFPLLPVLGNLQKQCYKGLQIHWTFLCHVLV